MYIVVSNAVDIHPPSVSTLDEYPNVKNWIARIEARPAVQRGLVVPDGSRSEVALPIVKERLALL